jgi:hypothetical protein
MFLTLAASGFTMDFRGVATAPKNSLRIYREALLRFPPAGPLGEGANVKTVHPRHDRQPRVSHLE